MFEEYDIKDIIKTIDEYSAILDNIEFDNWFMRNFFQSALYRMYWIFDEKMQESNLKENAVMFLVSQMATTFNVSQETIKKLYGIK